MDPITRKDLDESLDRLKHSLKEHMDLQLQPIVKNLEAVEHIIYGRMGTNGLAGAVKVLKWGYGLLMTGLGVVIHKLFSF